MVAPSPRTPTGSGLLDRLVAPGGASRPVDPVAIELDNLRSAHRALRAMTLRMQLLVQLGLLVATLFTPMLRFGTSDRTDAIGAARMLLAVSPAEVGDLAAHPLTVPGGLALVRIGLALLLTGVVLAVLGSRSLTVVPLRTAGAVMAGLTAFLLLLGAGLVLAGTAVLPDRRIGPAFGLVFPVGAGIWLWHAARSLRQLDWDWRRSDTDGGKGDHD